MRILFIATYLHPADAGPTGVSGALGYSVTCADALVAGLRGLGLQVDVIQSDARRLTVWTGEILAAVEAAVRVNHYDVALAFHALWPFTADLRWVLDDTAALPLVTYTHGSHWDETDLFRFEHYPKLRWADLGNLMAADRVLVVSEYMRNTILGNVFSVSEKAAGELTGRIRAVGLPIDLERIDAARRPRAGNGVTIVFNHAPNTAKQPGVFLDVAAEILERTAARFLVTRHFPDRSSWAGRLRDMAEAFPGRVVRGEDLPIDDYYAALWQSHVQISTATHESLGVATLEAMATGNHCLLPRIGSYPEVCGDDPDVLYEDVPELRERLLVLASTGPDAGVVARHRASARSRYSPARVAAAVHTVLGEVAGE
ncbi:glycosyltransferase family 4 protein [Sphaerisporangium corydalis]|uniref:Glycosyltransferase family 4 protein n=1 Tax=Sphaerisporangium corydalis TaxID=1441875 RepID=A0ABV9EL79_9ACTN|nr:glycosyltransferase family 4 protein [Sphaerisporangium corydalis]